jgi:hypothetical protein
MKNTRAWVLAFLSLSLLSSCGSATAKPSDYMETIAYRKDFRVMQLTDIHWNFDTDVARQKAYLTHIATTIQPDFIMITGDCLLDANEALANALYDTFESWGIPYGITWGNHDRQGLYSPAWMSKRAASGAHSYYREVDDQLMGRSNYVINLVDETNTPKWQIYSFDSNSYTDGGAFTYKYDYIRDDQVAWYEEEAALAEQTAGHAVPSLAYFHIPLWEWEYAKESLESKDGKVTASFGEIKEKSTVDVPGLANGIKFWVGAKHSKIFASAQAHRMKGLFCGHDHANDWDATYQGITLGYGVKSGRELYYGVSDNGYDLTGCAVSTLHEDGTLTLEHYFFQDEEGYAEHKEVLA